jgi:hypothetical protein
LSFTVGDFLAPRQVSTGNAFGQICQSLLDLAKAFQLLSDRGGHITAPITAAGTVPDVIHESLPVDQRSKSLH